MVTSQRVNVPEHPLGELELAKLTHSLTHSRESTDDPDTLLLGNNHSKLTSDGCLIFWRNQDQFLVEFFTFSFFHFPRLFLSGNPLECNCENLWIKTRILEEADTQDLSCTDDKGVSQAFISLMPPDCGNVRLHHNKQHSVLIFNI